MAKKRLEVVIAGNAKGARGAFDATEKRGGAFAKKMGQVGKAVAIGLGVGLVAVSGLLLKVGSDFDTAYKGIRVGTGATGQALTGLKDDFKAVVSDVPADFGDASTAIADLNTRLGLTGKPLQGLSTQFLELSRITETDVGANIDNLTRVFGDWEISADRMPGVLDQVFRASQASGIGIDDLSKSVVQFGAPLRNLGFGFEDSLALLAQFNKTGVNTETVFAGLKAGVGKLAKAGEDVPATFKRIVAEITKMGPGTKSTALAIELFGQRAGPDLADAISGGKFEIDSMLSAITGGSDTILQAGKDTQTLGEKWKLFTNKVMVKVEPIATRVFDALGRGMDLVLPLFDKVAVAAGPFVDNVMAKIDQYAPTVVAGLVSIGSALAGVDWAGVLSQASEFIGPVVDSVGGLATAVSDFASEAWPEMVKQFETAKPVLGAIALVVRSAVVGAIDALSGVTGFLTDHMDQLGPVLLTAAAGFAAFKTTKAVVTGFSNVVDAGKKVASTVSGATSKLRAFFQPGGGRDTVALRAMQVRDGVTKAAGALKSGATQAAAWGKAGLVSAGNWAKATAATVANKVAQVASTVASKAAAVGQWALNAAMAANPIVLVVLVIGALIAAVVLAYQKVDWFRAGVDAMGRAVVGAFNWVKDTVVSVFNWVKDNWPLILGIITGPIGLAVSTITGYWDTIKGGFTGVKNWIGDRISDVVGFVSGMGGRISRAASGMWGGITSAFKGAINTIIRGWNAIEFKVPGFKVGPIGYSGFTLGLPDIPQLHTGGTFRAPRPGGEGLALLRDRERVLTPSQGASAQRGTTGMVQINQNLTLEIAGHVLTERKLVALVRSGFLHLQRTSSSPILPGVSG